MDWSYVAGFFDGEGNISITISRKFLNGNLGCYILIRIYQQSLEPLKEIQKFLGFGRIYKSKQGLYELTFNKKSHVKFFLEGIKDKVILKKDQLDYVLKHFSFERTNNMNFDIDTFRSFIKRKNVEKFRTHHTIVKNSV